MTNKPEFAVVTAYYKEDFEIIKRAIDSVNCMRSNEYKVVHYLISDGFPNKLIDNLDVTHIKLNKSHGDYGDTPRLIGAMLAIREGCKGLMFLDADNIVYPDHLLETKKKYVDENSNIILAKRDFLRLDGTVINFQSDEDDNYHHVDTGCFVFFDEAVFEALEWAKIPNELSCFGDRYFWNLLRSKRNQYGATDKPTIGYTCLWRSVYETIGEVPPISAKEIDSSIVNEYFASLSDVDKNKIKKLLKIFNSN